jgi:cyanate permease
MYAGAGISQTIDRGVKYAAEVQEIEFTLRQAMKTPCFWLLLLSTASLSFVPPVLTIHGVPILTDMGIDPVRAAVVMGIMSSGSILGTVFGGLVADHVKKQHQRFLIGGTFFLGVIGFVAILLNPTLTMVYPLFTILHFIGGFFSLMNSIIMARYFGRKAFGSIRGTLTLFMLPVSVISPIYAGWAYDTTHSYTTVFTICAVLLTVSTVFISLAAPPKAPAHVTNIYKIV